MKALIERIIADTLTLGLLRPIANAPCEGAHDPTGAAEPGHHPQFGVSRCQRNGMQLGSDGIRAPSCGNIPRAAAVTNFPHADGFTGEERCRTLSLKFPSS